MRTVAFTETDLAAIARAETALKRLDAVTRGLCRRRATDETIETLREVYQDLGTAIQVAKTYISNQRREPEGVNQNE